MIFNEKIHNKTKILVFEDKNQDKIFQLLMHIIQFYGREIDFINAEKQQISSHNDFVLIKGDENEDFLEVNPNIVLISKVSENEDFYQNFLKTITPGGILVYNEEDENLKNLVENSENYFRKIPYKTPDFQISNNEFYLKTDLGFVPVNIIDENISYLEGTRLLCQQIGTMEEDFYDALSSF